MVEYHVCFQLTQIEIDLYIYTNISVVAITDVKLLLTQDHTDLPRPLFPQQLYVYIKVAFSLKINKKNKGVINIRLVQRVGNVKEQSEFCSHLSRLI